MKRASVGLATALTTAVAAAPAVAQPIAENVEDVRLTTTVRVTDGSTRQGTATLRGHVDIVVSCRPYPTGTTGSCAGRHRIGKAETVRIPLEGPTRRQRLRSKVRVVSDSTRRARLRVPVGPVTCRGIDDEYQLAFSIPLVLVGSGVDPRVFAVEAPGLGCSVSPRRTSRADAVRRARVAFAERFRGTSQARARAFVDCRDENHGRITWQCVRRVPTGRDRRGPSRCWRLTVSRISPNRFGRRDRASFATVSAVSRESRVAYAIACRPAV